MRITPELLIRVTGCSKPLAELYARHLDEACQAYAINTTDRLAAFLAQLGHESGSLRYVRELASGEGYEGRRDLGNTQPGDGPRYRGRGLIQVTGRSNYRAAAHRMRGLGAPDFEAEPEALEQPQWAAFSAADYWQANGFNAIADAGEIDRISRGINRGDPDSRLPANHEPERRERWRRARAALAGDAADPVVKTLPATVGTTPLEEQPMLPLLKALGESLVAAFTPLAAEKITKEISRHTDRPEVAEQVTTAIIEAAKAATGEADPIAAVAAARAEPAVLAQVEKTALEQLASMAPLLQQLDALDRQAFADEEASRAAAAVRAAADPADMAPALTRAALIGVASLILFVGIIVVVQMVKSGKADPEVWGLLVALVTWATAKAGSIYDYRFGSSRGSGAKDAVIGELSRGQASARGRPPGA